MTLKVMAFLVGKPGIDAAELIDHYEHHHVPLILSLAPAPLVYKRNYLTHRGDAGRVDDVDVITELVFADRAAYRQWAAAMYAPGSGVQQDEERFLDRSRTRSYIVDEHVSPVRAT